MTLYDIWLRDSPGDFAAGVRLLAQHDGAKHLTRTTWARLQTLAATGDYVGTYNQGKLEGALQKVDIAPDAVPQPALSPPPPVVAPEVPPPAPHPSPLTSDKAIALHKEHAHVHALMVAATTDEERAEHARDIKERIVPALDAEYDRLRAAQSNPTPDPSPEKEGGRSTKTASSFKKLQSLRSRISTLRKKIPLEKDPKRKAKLEQELSDKITERERLEAELA